MKRSSLPLLATCLVAACAAAQDSHERSDLSLVQQQISVIEQLADRAKSGSEDIDSARYRFDYLRFAADLQRIRQGIHTYLSPSRAQPADLIELAGDYRDVAPLARSPDEHD